MMFISKSFRSIRVQYHSIIHIFKHIFESLNQIRAFVITILIESPLNLLDAAILPISQKFDIVKQFPRNYKILN